MLAHACTYAYTYTYVHRANDVKRMPVRVQVYVNGDNTECRRDYACANMNSGYQTFFPPQIIN